MNHTYNHYSFYQKAAMSHEKAKCVNVEARLYEALKLLNQHHENQIYDHDYNGSGLYAETRRLLGRG